MEYVYFPEIFYDPFVIFQELRRRRNEVTVDLRKSKKDDLLSKRRNVCVDDDEPTSPLQDSSNKIPMMSIEEIQENVYSSDFNTAFKATQAARKILSRERNPPIDALIQAGIVPQLIKFLSTNTPNAEDNGKMQFESAWALTNIASGTALQTRCVVEHGATVQFIKLLSSPVRLSKNFKISRKARKKCKVLISI